MASYALLYSIQRLTDVITELLLREKGITKSVDLANAPPVPRPAACNDSGAYAD